MMPATYQVRDVPFDVGTGMVPAILVAVCDRCNEVVSIPAQSTPALDAATGKAVSLRVEIPLTENDRKLVEPI